MPLAEMAGPQVGLRAGDSRELHAHLLSFLLGLLFRGEGVRVRGKVAELELWCSGLRRCGLLRW